MYNTYKLLVNPYIFWFEETTKKSDEELLQRVSSVFSIWSSLPTVKPYKIWALTPKYNWISFEYKWDHNSLWFFTSTKDLWNEAISSFLQWIYPVSESIKVDYETDIVKNKVILNSDWNFSLSPEYNISSTTVIFSSNDISSINTFSDSKLDSFHSILNLLSSVDEGYFSRYKLSYIPATNYWKDLVKKDDFSLQNYKEKKSMFKKSESKNASSIERWEIEHVWKSKVSNAHWYFVTLRCCFIWKNQQILDSKLQSLKDILSSLMSKKTKIEFHSEKDFIQSYYNSVIVPYSVTKGSLMVLNELTTVIHPPIYWNVKIKNLDITLFQKLPIPAELIKTNEELTKDDIILWMNEYWSSRNAFSLPLDSRFRHVYALWKSWVWKSTMMENAILQDIYNGQWVCVIDPHWDLIDDVMKHFPDPRNPKYKDRYKDLIYIDFWDKESQIWLNILEAKDEHEQSIALNSFMSLLKKLFPDSWDSMWPYFEDYVRNVCTSIMLAQDIYKPTIDDIVRALQSEEYQEHIIDYFSRDKHTDLINFWNDHQKQTWEDSQSQNKDDIIPFIRTKFAPFLSNVYVKNVTWQEDSTVDFFDAMNTNKIILVKLAKGKIWPENMQILWLILISKILKDVFKRESIPKEKRTPFFLYVDEFQNFITPEFESLFSEARKYNFWMTVANQYLDQLKDNKSKDDSVMKSILWNAGTCIAFKAGSEDVRKLEEHFWWNRLTLPSEAFANIEKYNAYVTTVGWSSVIKTLSPFSMKTIMTDKPVIIKRDSNWRILRDGNWNTQIDSDTINEIISYSKSIYTRNKEVIDKHLSNFNKFF